MHTLRDLLPSPWAWLVLIIEIIVTVVAFVHVVLRKHDPRAAGYWVAIILLVPIVGAMLYAVLGINIIRRSARLYREAVHTSSSEHAASIPHLLPEYETEVQAMPGFVHGLKKLSRLPLVGGNTVEPLRNGDEAMIAMLEAIEGAQHSVALSTYIFETQGVGSRFCDALETAMRRDVDVRVIVDAAGTRYSKPSIIGELRSRGIRAQRFMPPNWRDRLLTLNLRNHRKLLIVDGRTGFTGGMNIRPGNMLNEKPANPVRDMHFRVRGPIVGQLQRVFAEDWQFCTSEWLLGSAWQTEHDLPGDVAIAGLPDGPDDDNQTISFAISTALDEARREVRIVSPYFLPPEPVFSSLISCALRGVKVRVITPGAGANNIPFVHWASRTMYPPLLKHGVRIFESGAPFDHSKLMMIDGILSIIGSTNLDSRSLKLNFEFNLACFDDKLAPALNAEFDQKLAGSREVTQAMLDAQTPWENLRNGVARLFVPLI